MSIVTHELYGEAIDKSFLTSQSIALVEFDGIKTTTENYGLDKDNYITVKFHERRLHEDQDLYVREGDYVQYGDAFYEIVTLSEERQLFGQVDHLFQIIAKCIKTRRGLIDFEVLDSEAQASAVANAALSDSLSGDSGSGSDSGSENPAPFAAAKIVYGAEDGASPTSGIIATPVAAGSSVNDFFSIPEGQELDINTMMIFLNGSFQLVTDAPDTGDFYLSPSSEIISNFALEEGDTLVVVFLSAISSYFGG